MPTSRTLAIRFLLYGFLNYVRSSAKNCIKVLIGRKTFSAYSGAILWLYFCHLLGRRPIREVTFSWNGLEGAGSLALMTMRAIVFARASGLTYIHTPFTVIAHADRPMSEWADAWEKHFNLGFGEAARNGDDREIANFYHFQDLLPLFEAADLTEAFHAAIPDFRRKYYSNKSPRKNAVLTVCAHLRRGDVTPTRADIDMWTGNALTARIIGNVRGSLDAHGVNYRICVLSQGKIDDFSELNSLGIEFFLDADPIWTMQEAIEADILIIPRRSCFSYVAGILSDGITLLEEGGYPPIRGWVTYRQDGELDCADFEGKLRQLIEGWGPPAVPNVNRPTAPYPFA